MGRDGLDIVNDIVNVTKGVHEVTQSRVQCATTKVPFQQGEFILKGYILKNLGGSNFSMENAKSVMVPPQGKQNSFSFLKT